MYDDDDGDDDDDDDGEGDGDEDDGEGDGDGDDDDDYDDDGYYYYDDYENTCLRCNNYIQLFLQAFKTRRVDHLLTTCLNLACPPVIAGPNYLTKTMQSQAHPSKPLRLVPQ